MGSVFFPLRACSGKRNRGDTLASDGCNKKAEVGQCRVEISGFHGIKACGKGVEGEN